MSRNRCWASPVPGDAGGGDTGLAVRRGAKGNFGRKPGVCQWPVTRFFCNIMIRWFFPRDTKMALSFGRSANGR